MQDAHEQQLSEILEAIEITSPIRFSVADVPFTVTGGAAALAAAYGLAEPGALDRPAQPQPQDHPPSPGSQLGAKRAAPPPLVGYLTTVLYANCYCRPFRGHVDPPPETPPALVEPDAACLALLSESNRSRERWERGWQIVQVQPTGQVTARRGDRTRSLWAGEFVSRDGPGAPPRPGALIDVFHARESTSLQHATYHAFGESSNEMGGCLSIARVYWNLAPAAVPRLVRAITTRLNRFAVPFRFKCFVAGTPLDRSDGAVLYLPKEYWRITLELLAEMLPAIADDLREGTPLFAKPIARGVAAAEDPANGESFGQHRCRLIAEAVWEAHAQENDSPAARRAQFGRALSIHGVDPKRWHLNLGSRDVYEPLSIDQGVEALV
jgi:hypothetical protein